MQSFGAMGCKNKYLLREIGQFTRTRGEDDLLPPPEGSCHLYLPTPPPPDNYRGEVWEANFTGGRFAKIGGG